MRYPFAITKVINDGVYAKQQVDSWNDEDFNATFVNMGIAALIVANAYLKANNLIRECLAGKTNGLALLIAIDLEIYSCLLTFDHFQSLTLD